MTSKITDLTAATAAAGDEIPANRAGSDKKLLAQDIAALGPNSYAGIYIYDGAYAQTIATGSTPAKLVAFAQAGGANGLSANCTTDKANSKITITRAGVYYLNYSVSFLSSVASVNWECYVFADGSIIPSTGALSKMGTGAGTDTKCINGGGFFSILANKDVDFRAYHSHGSNCDITISHANLCVRFVGT